MATIAPLRVSFVEQQVQEIENKLAVKPTKPKYPRGRRRNSPKLNNLLLSSESILLNQMNQSIILTKTTSNPNFLAPPPNRMIDMNSIEVARLKVLPVWYSMDCTASSGNFTENFIEENRDKPNREYDVECISQSPYSKSTSTKSSRDDTQQENREAQELALAVKQLGEKQSYKLDTQQENREAQELYNVALTKKQLMDNKSYKRKTSRKSSKSRNKTSSKQISPPRKRSKKIKSSSTVLESTVDHLSLESILLPAPSMEYQSEKDFQARHKALDRVFLSVDDGAIQSAWNPVINVNRPITYSVAPTKLTSHCSSNKRDDRIIEISYEMKAGCMKKLNAKQRYPVQLLAKKCPAIRFGCGAHLSEKDKKDIMRALEDFIECEERSGACIVKDYNFLTPRRLE